MIQPISAAWGNIACSKGRIGLRRAAPAIWAWIDAGDFELKKAGLASFWSPAKTKVPPRKRRNGSSAHSERAHARTGDAVQISGYVGTSNAFDRAIAAFAAAYAQANEQDHAALLHAIEDGRVAASAD